MFDVRFLQWLLAVPPAVILAALLAARASEPPRGDPVRGAQVYERCVACHSLTRNRTGPKHCGVFGRPVAGVADFDYSPAMAEAGGTWTYERLDRFLKAPLVALPGTAMGYDGVKDPRDRADLIAFLRSADESSDLCH